MIAIIDYGLGNLGSIEKMLKKATTAKVVVTSDLGEIERAEKLILPGVGPFDRGMSNLESMNLVPTLRRRVQIDHIPILGICLGMQLLTNSSEEGQKKGLGWIAAQTKRFQIPNGAGLKVPHMGWSDVEWTVQCPLSRGIERGARFYFVHSFHVVTDVNSTILAESEYGVNFSSAIHSDNVYGVQFHPEKSHNFGLQLLRNFAEL